MHLVSTSRYAQKARVEIPEVTSWLMQAPQVARDKAPFYWTYLDRPDNGSIFMTWQPLQLMGTNFASDGYIWPPQEQHMRQEVGNGVVLEMYYHGAGYAMNEPFATHSRRRFRLLPPNTHNPNAPQVDPSPLVPVHSCQRAPTWSSWPSGRAVQAVCGDRSAAWRKLSSLSRRRRSASTRSVLSVQAQNIPATAPLASRAGE